MYRPGGFPEYNPQDQKVFDRVLDIITQSFQQHNFQHIWTPAVESNEILLKGGETVANEIFGLVGLKDFERGEIARAKKDYSLHFDLTVPFARYTLDHQNDITFPFKRYQAQPVWRGERQQRGRFKEFWQCDVDSIWKSGTEVGYRYAAETIFTLQSAIASVFQSFAINKKFISHVSHIGVTKAYLHDLLDNDSDLVDLVIGLLDKFYKLEYTKFTEELTLLIGAEKSKKIFTIIETKDYTLLKDYPGYEVLSNTLSVLEKLGVSIHYDFAIVRGLGYYTDIVFETFGEGEMSLGSICSGGGYEDFTKFISTKQLFSGMGGSIGLSRMMEIVLEHSSAEDESESYMFLNFADTFDNILTLYKQFISEGKTCEFYPVDAKFGKQLEYADKKGCRYVVILGGNEVEKGIYQIKDLKSGEMKEYPL